MPNPECKRCGGTGKYMDISPSHEKYDIRCNCDIGNEPIVVPAGNANLTGFQMMQIMNFNETIERSKPLVDAMRLPEIVECHLIEFSKRNPFVNDHDFLNASKVLQYLNQLSAPVYKELLEQINKKV